MINLLLDMSAVAKLGGLGLATAACWWWWSGRRRRARRSAPIVVIGDAFADMLAQGVPRMPVWGTDTTVHALALHAGGTALNTASHLAGFGDDVTLLTALGADALGAEARDALRALRDSEDALHRSVSVAAGLVLDSGDDPAGLAAACFLLPSADLLQRLEPP